MFAPKKRLLLLLLQITLLSERKMELERRVHAVLGDNELLQNTMDDQRERTLMLEKQCHEKDQQVPARHPQAPLPPLNTRIYIYI